jgi:hypothetical protein
MCPTNIDVGSYTSKGMVFSCVFIDMKAHRSFESTVCRIAMAKAAFNKKRALFTSTLDLELSKKLVKCYIWSIALYGAEN